MPAIGFICPDFTSVSFEECLKSCRLREELPCGRCKALPFLRRAARQREWTGIPSTTQLLIGTREAYLKITEPYCFNPDDKVYALLGTHVHGILERFAQGDHLSEERLRDEICTGAFDFYDGETMTFYDYKTWGSYKVMGALGLRAVEVPETDESGNPVMNRSGKNKGTAKTRRIWVAGDLAARADALLETSIQMSNYRDKLLSVLPEGYAVKRMAVQAISRDSGLMVSTRRGITENAPLIPVNGISRHWVNRYLGRKRDLLLEALARKTVPPSCRRRETWGGRKCERYCEVREACSRHRRLEEGGTSSARSDSGTLSQEEAGCGERVSTERGNRG